jgi:hypothetical protein
MMHCASEIVVWFKAHIFLERLTKTARTQKGNLSRLLARIASAEVRFLRYNGSELLQRMGLVMEHALVVETWEL